MVFSCPASPVRWLATWARTVNVIWFSVGRLGSRWGDQRRLAGHAHTHPEPHADVYAYVYAIANPDADGDGYSHHADSHVIRHTAPPNGYVYALTHCHTYALAHAYFHPNPAADARRRCSHGACAHPDVSLYFGTSP